MQTSRVLALAALVASCNVDKLLNDEGGQGSPPAPPGAELVFSSQPTDATAGEPITPPPRVTLQDSAGQPDTSFDGSVTVALGANPGGATLEGDATVEAVDGVATFANLRVSNAGNDYTLRATAPGTGLTAATSSAFDIAAPNQAPTAAFTPNCSGLTCSFTNTSIDPDGSIASSLWAFGDGVTSTAHSPSHAYGAGGSYSVTLTVTDNEGATDVVSQPVMPSQPNRAPSVNAGPDAILLVGGLTYTLNATFGDPDNDGPWTYTVDWGHGSPTTGTATSQGSITATHTYPLLPPGSYRVRVTVVDSRGATGSDELTVTVVV